MAVWPTCGRGLGSIWQGQDEYSVGGRHGIQPSRQHRLLLPHGQSAVFDLCDHPVAFPIPTRSCGGVSSRIASDQGGHPGRWDPAGCTARNHRSLSIRNRTAFRRRDIASSCLQWIARLPRHLTCGCQHGDSNHLRASGCELSRRLGGWDEIFPCRWVETKPQLNSINQYFTSAVNRYNAASIDLNRRFRGGMAFRTNYTFSKSMDNASSLGGQQAIGNPPVVLDPQDRMRDFGLSAFDVRHRFSFSGSYELPFGKGKRFLKDAGGIVNQAVSGWQLNIINNLRSGFPFTPALGFNWSRDGNTSAPDRVSFAPGRTLNGIYLRKPEQWVDPTAFVLPPAGTYGNAGRNILIGPGLANVDVSVFKTTRLSEGRNLQLRAEIFNVLNHANFGIPSPIMLTNTGATAAAAGVITSTAGTSRQIQLGAKLNF